MLSVPFRPVRGPTAERSAGIDASRPAASSRNSWIGVRCATIADSSCSSPVSSARSSYGREVRPVSRSSSLAVAVSNARAHRPEAAAEARSSRTEKWPATLASAAETDAAALRRRRGSSGSSGRPASPARAQTGGVLPGVLERSGRSPSIAADRAPTRASSSSVAPVRPSRSNTRFDISDAAALV